MCFLLAGCADYQSTGRQSSMICEELAQNICELALCKYNRWADEVCYGWDSCCFCRCFNDGHLIPDSPEECNCVEPEITPDEYRECQGEMIRDSEICLQDEDVCRDWIEELVNELCLYWYP
jgi:hypothetical protein